LPGGQLSARDSHLDSFLACYYSHSYVSRFWCPPHCPPQFLIPKFLIPNSLIRISLFPFVTKSNPRSALLPVFPVARPLVLAILIMKALPRPDPLFLVPDYRFIRSFRSGSSPKRKIPSPGHPCRTSAPGYPAPHGCSSSIDTISPSS